MTYQLRRLAAGNYDLILNGTVVGSVVRCTLSKNAPTRWRAELAVDGETWPPPFTEAEHEFGSLEGIREWLDGLVVADKWAERH